ncbi:MAG: hypothetical protein V4530_06070 [Pseudomonadota bacterium]
MQPLVRLSDWETPLNALIAARWTTPLDWGVHDCALWGADVVAAETGVDHGTKFRGKYSDAAGAAKALRDFGGGTITRTFDMFLPRRPIGNLRRGDLVMVGKDRDGAVGVVVGADALLIGEAGLVRRPMAMWERGWGVG